MKGRIKAEYLFLFFGLISFVGLSSVHEPKRLIMFSVYSLAVLALYIIKNKYIAYPVSVLLIAGYSVYSISHAVFMIPSYLMIVVYKNIIRKIRAAEGKKTRGNEISHMGLHFLILLALVEIIYAVLRFFENEFYAYYNNAGELVALAVALTVIFVSGCFSSKVEKEARGSCRVSKNNYVTLNLVNFTGMLLFLGSVALNYGAYQDFQINYTVVCFPWSVWLCVLVYEKNPITEAMLKLIEEKLKEISERRIKEK